MLAWLSEERHGSLRQLQSRLIWLMGTSRAATSRRDAGRWIRDALTVGRIDVDWEAGTWVAASPVLTTLPGGHGYALLTGGRPAALNDRLRDDPVVHRTRGPGSDSGFPAPSAVFVEFRDADELEATARRLGVKLVNEAARQLCSRLQRIAPGARMPPLARNGAPIERWDGDSLRFEQFEGWGEQQSGLYRQEVFGRPRYALYSQGSWYKTTHAEGVYIVSGRNDELIRWRPDPADRSESLGTLIVDNGMSLPDAQRRVAGLCTGMRPTIGTHSRNTRFDNVPRDIAEGIAHSLRQPLTAIP